MTIKIKPCPFCKTTPTGKKFMSTEHGPQLECEKCGAYGPPPLGTEKTYMGGEGEERRLQKVAIEKWNKRALIERIRELQEEKISILKRLKDIDMSLRLTTTRN